MIFLIILACIAIYLASLLISQSLHDGVFTSIYDNEILNKFIGILCVIPIINTIIAVILLIIFIIITVFVVICDCIFD